MESAQLRHWLLSTFRESERAAVSAYRCFVAGRIGDARPCQQLGHQVLPGSSTSLEGLRRPLPPDRDFTEVPRAQRRRTV